MDFLSTLQTDVKMLMAAGAIALLAALLSTTKRNEHRFMALFTVLMLVAGLRFHMERTQDEENLRAGSSVQTKAGTQRPGPR